MRNVDDDAPVSEISALHRRMRGEQRNSSGGRRSVLARESSDDRRRHGDVASDLWTLFSNAVKTFLYCISVEIGLLLLTPNTKMSVRLILQQTAS